MADKYMALIIGLLLLIGSPSAALSQPVVLDTPALQSSGEAYAQSIRFQGIDTDVTYYDPSQPPPELENTRLQQPRQPSREAPSTQSDIDFDTFRFLLFLASALVVLAIAYLFARYGGRLPVSFSRKPDEAASKLGKAQTDQERENDAPAAGMDAILAMRDRREALVALCRNLLARTIATQGVLFQRSWTDRDAMRRIPAHFHHRDALQALVFASEKVQFGGRDVTEDEFQQHLSRLGPLWQATAS